MKLLAWNIQHGGGARLPRIVEEIAAYDPDVIAVTEFRTGPGVALGAALKERGLPNVETTHPTGNQNGIAVFAHAYAPYAALYGTFRQSRRRLDIDLPEYGFCIGVLHVMAAGHSTKDPSTVAKTHFWDAMLHAAEARLPVPFLFVGDLNTGAHRLDEIGKTFVCAEHSAGFRSWAGRAYGGITTRMKRSGLGTRS